MSGHDIPLDEIGIDSSESVPYDSFDSAPNSPHVHLGGDFDDEHEPVVNEDHPELTNREKWGWYLYDCANSVYSTCVAVPTTVWPCFSRSIFTFTSFPLLLHSHFVSI